jgi:hypothetical protein
MAMIQGFLKVYNIAKTQRKGPWFRVISRFIILSELREHDHG